MMKPQQERLFPAYFDAPPTPPKGQLLKWIGNKQRMAGAIAAFFPTFRAYHEPFLGSGALLGTVAPEKGFASDSFAPLVEIWTTLRQEPEKLKRWYSERWERMMGASDRVEAYEHVKKSYNLAPNGADLLFLCRACYGGVVRFRKSDGHMSTPCGAHTPIPPLSFSRRVDDWRQRIAGTTFRQLEFEEALALAKAGDLIYCDPPYTHSQAILYGAQEFSLAKLLSEIAICKGKGVAVALSIDGTKKSGNQICDLPIPDGLFEREFFIDCGRSMLRRFQVAGGTVERERVADRLLLTY